MKFKIMMKDPDTAHDAVNEAVKEELAAIGLNEEEQDAVCELRAEKVRTLLEKWFQYGEYLTVEVDTEAETIRVVPVSEG